MVSYHTNQSHLLTAVETFSKIQSILPLRRKKKRKFSLPAPPKQPTPPPVLSKKHPNSNKIGLFPTPSARLGKRDCCASLVRHVLSPHKGRGMAINRRATLRLGQSFSPHPSRVSHSNTNFPFSQFTPFHAWDYSIYF